MLPAATPRIALRPMTRSDLRQVQRIEREAYGDAWPQTTFEQELNNGLAHYFVAVELPPERTASATRPPPGFLSPFRWLASLGRTRDPLLGFAGLWYTVDQLHLVTIAVAARHQHRGIARRMLLHCFALAEEAGLPSIALEVRASNERAIRLYESFGLRRAGRRPRYYADNGEDAIVMLTPQLDQRGFTRHLQRLRAGERPDHRRRSAYRGVPSPAAAPGSEARD